MGRPPSSMSFVPVFWEVCMGCGDTPFKLGGITLHALLAKIHFICPVTCFVLIRHLLSTIESGVLNPPLRLPLGICVHSTLVEREELNISQISKLSISVEANFMYHAFPLPHPLLSTPSHTPLHHRHGSPLHHQHQHHHRRRHAPRN